MFCFQSGWVHHTHGASREIFGVILVTFFFEERLKKRWGWGELLLVQKGSCNKGGWEEIDIQTVEIVFHWGSLKKVVQMLQAWYGVYNGHVGRIRKHFRRTL